jgi:hypothetical protein
MNPLHLIWIIPLAASVGFLAGTLIKVSNYGILDLPFWMWERIILILSEHSYEWCEEIIQAIKERMK